MDAFLATFVMIFLAELGDKTQLIVMAFAAKYDWRQVLTGMTLGIFAVHALAVGVGSFVGQLLSPERMTLIASLLFLYFGYWTLRGGDEAEETAADSCYGPVLTVATSFFVGEMGDKTQFAAMTMAAQYDFWPMVLLGAVVGMVLADSLGILAGAFLHRKLPARKMRYLSAGIFLFFGVLGLLQSAFQGVFA